VLIVSLVQHHILCQLITHLSIPAARLRFCYKTAWLGTISNTTCQAILLKSSLGLANDYTVACGRLESVIYVLQGRKS
jgi:hypothetical protein